MANGCSCDEFIVSHGAQSAIGHHMGAGPIVPGEPIVIDIWPRDRESACFADMTRTFVVGEPTDELVEWQRLVKEALDRSLELIRPGVRGRAVYDAACEVFESAGYTTQRTKEPGTALDHGFFHGLGHGVGLEVHEAPGMGLAGSDVLSGGRRRHRRAGPLPAGHRRLPARGPGRRDRRRLRESDPVPVRAPAVTSISNLLQEDRRYPPSPEFAAQANAQPDDLRARLRRALGRPRRASASPGSSRSRSSTSGSRRTRSGTSAARSTSASTASTATSRPAAATRSPTTGRASPRTTGARSPTPTSSATSSASRTRCARSACARAPPSRSTWGWCRSCPWRCSPARGSAPRTPSSSAASPPTRSPTGWSTWAARC